VGIAFSVPKLREVFQSGRYTTGEFRVPKISNYGKLLKSVVGRFPNVVLISGSGIRDSTHQPRGEKGEEVAISPMVCTRK